MTPSSDELLDFDRDRLAGFDPAKAEENRARYGDVYRAQLVAGWWIEGWRERATEDDGPGNVRSDDFKRGMDHALRRVSAHLFQGDLLPDAVLYDNTVKGRLG